MRLKSIALISLMCTIYANGANFTVDINNETTGDSYVSSSDTLTDIINELELTNIESHIGYNETNHLLANLDFRGLPVRLNFAENSTTLSFDIDSLGIHESFTGNTRDDSVDMLEDWFKDGGVDVEKIMKKLVEISPVDPIAGNPNSLMALTVEADFKDGFMNIATKQRSSRNSSKGNRIAIDATYKSLDTDGRRSNSFTLPLSYSFVSADNDKESLNISLPITYIDFEGAKSYNVGLGTSYSKPINENWVLTPAIKYSIVGSSDLGALAQLGSVSLSSSYSFYLGNKYTLSIGNMVGYYTTLKVYDGDYAYDPDIGNTVFRNALLYSIPTENIVKNTSLDVYVIDTQYTGTELYLNSYDEFGFSFGYNKVNLNVLSDKEEYSFNKELKIGMSYLTSSKSNGFKVNFGFMF